MQEGNRRVHRPADEQFAAGEHRQNILEMSPSELAAFFVDLEKQGTLAQFLETAMEDPAARAKASYWEKWLTKEQRKLLDAFVEKKKSVYPAEEREGLPLGLEKRFSREDMEAIFSNMGAIQLTFGCSKGCPFCGFDAVSGVREHIQYAQLANLFQKYGTQLGQTKPFLYWASEPSDYASKEGLEDRTYQDVHELATTYAGYSPGITSRETDLKQWLAFLGTQNSRVSLFNYSERQTEGKLARIPEPVHKIGRGEKHREGMGMSFSARNMGGKGIGCFNGMLLTPRGLYNVIQTPSRPEYPQGQVVVPFESSQATSTKVGDPVHVVLAHSIVAHQNPWREATSDDECRVFSEYLSGYSPFITVFQNGEYYDVIFDGEGKVKGIEESQKHTLDTLSERFRQLKSLKKDVLYFSPATSSAEIVEHAEEYRAVVERIFRVMPEIDIAATNKPKELYAVVSKELDRVKKEIKGIVTSQLKKLGGESAFDVSWPLGTVIKHMRPPNLIDNEMWKGVFDDNNFQVEKDEESGQYRLRYLDDIPVPLKDTFILMRFEFVSEPHPLIRKFIKKSRHGGRMTEIDPEDVEKTFSETGLTFKLRMHVG